MAEAKTRIPLREFVQSVKPKCWVCGLPEREEIDQELRNDVAVSIIVRWLTYECGYDDASADVVSGHKRRKHYEKEAA